LRQRALLYKSSGRFAGPLSKAPTLVLRALTWLMLYLILPVAVFVGLYLASLFVLT
jgi:hypothetical protein